MTTLYGIRNCDTMKKARRLLDERGVGYAFHDYKVAGVPEDRLRQWVARSGWERVLNRSGTTFRQLADADKAALDAERAVAVMLAHPSTIRRLVVEDGETLLIGFEAAAYERAFPAS